MRQLGPEVLFVELTDRKKQILKVVVEDYVRTAEPVGSKAIAAEMGGVSSATIRNELSDLTELGYLEQLQKKSMPVFSSSSSMVTDQLRRWGLPPYDLCSTQNPMAL